LKRDWRVVDRGANGEAFLWKKRSSNRFVMIDIFNPDPIRRCYSVFALRNYPQSSRGKKDVIGVGCADDAEEGWGQAYERARRIAEDFMTND
jgi:hypothetical protein